MFQNPLDSIQKENIGYLEKEYIGYVEDNNDPLKLGRVKVRAAVYEDIIVEAIPWASPTPNYFLGSSNKSGSFSVPEIGSEVTIYFPTFDEYQPYFKGAPVNTETKIPLFDTNYPKRYGFVDSLGNAFYIDKVEGTVRFEHPAGTVLKINAIGEIEVLSMATLKLESVTSIELKAPSITATGNFKASNGRTTAVPTGLDVLFFQNGLLVSQLMEE